MKKGFYFLFIFCIVFLSIIKSTVLKSSIIVELSNFLFHLSQFLLHVFWDSVVGVREGNGNPLRYSCLENLVDGGAW